MRNLKLALNDEMARKLCALSETTSRDIASHCHQAIEAHLEKYATDADRQARLYICGPMTGYCQDNYPAFNAEATRLRALGYHVENPAENEKPKCGTWEGYLRNSVQQMLRCDYVALLPGWPDSKGAVLERSLATRLGMRCVPADFFIGKTMIKELTL